MADGAEAKPASPPRTATVGLVEEAVDGEKLRFQATSSAARRIVLAEQPWYRPSATRRVSDEYLATAPPGAFLVRIPANPNSHMMDVQAGPRIGHVLLPHIVRNEVLYYRLPGTPYVFQHLYDLVRFCHYNPFYFETINTEGASITLSIAMAKRAEKINAKKNRRRTRKGTEEEQAKQAEAEQQEELQEQKALEAELAAERRQVAAEEQAFREAAERLQTDQRTEDETQQELGRLEEEVARQQREQEMLRAEEERLRLEEERLLEELRKKEEQERVEREVWEAARKMEEERLAEELVRQIEEEKQRADEAMQAQLQREAESRREQERLRKEMEDKERERVAMELEAKIKADEQQRTKDARATHHKTEAQRAADEEREKALQKELQRQIAQQAAQAKPRKSADFVKPPAVAPAKTFEPTQSVVKRIEDREKKKADERRRRSEEEEFEEEDEDDYRETFQTRFRRASEELQAVKLQQQRQEMQMMEAQVAELRLRRDQLVAEEARLARAAEAHKQALQDAAAAPRAHSPPKKQEAELVEDGKVQFINGKRPVNLKKVKTEREHPYDRHACPQCPGGDCAEGYKINRFKPTKCSNCMHVHALKGGAAPAPAPAAAASSTALGARFVPTSKPGGMIAQMLQRLGPQDKARANPDKVRANPRGGKRGAGRAHDIIDPLADMDAPRDPFKDPYILVPADEPRDSNLTQLTARADLVMGLVGAALSNAGAKPSRQLIEEQLRQVRQLELMLAEEATAGSNQANDDEILAAIARTNPAQYADLVAEREQQLVEREANFKAVNEKVIGLRQRLQTYLPSKAA